MPQHDPGSEGNGEHEHLPPYDMAPEAREHGPGVRPGKVLPGQLRDGIQGRPFRSEVFDGWCFRHWVYVPAAYDPKQPAALMVVQDGSGFLANTNLRTDIVLDNLIERGEMPVTIGLFIEPGGPNPDGVFEDEHRAEAYDTVSDRYVRFLTEEIVPQTILAHYSITEDPEGWGVAGFSSGGICAFTAAWFLPNRFRKVFTINGSFTPLAKSKRNKAIAGDDYPRLVRDAETKPLRVTLLSGTKDIIGELGNWLEANDAMARALGDKGYTYRYMRGQGHHWLKDVGPDQGANDLPNALRWLWRGYQVTT